jgi:hypothetical protein
MPDARARPSIAEDGLPDYDRAEVTAATRLLSGQWLEQFNECPSGGSYARLDQTGTGGPMPPFPLRRQDSSVVLTDRLSDQSQHIVTQASWHGQNDVGRV